MKTINIKQKTPKVLKALGSVSKKVSGAVMGVDLIDGQKRGESIARRIFFLLAVAMFIYFLLLTFIGAKDKVQVQVPKEKVYAKEVLPDVVENINGDIVTTKASGEVGMVPAENFMESSTQAVKRFTQSYGGSRIDGNYFAILESACGNTETLKLVVAVSVAETSMGRNTSNSSNYWGYYKGGNRKYDPTKEQMAEDICGAFNGYYKDVVTNKAKANRYVGYDSTNWLKNVNWALSQMK